MGETVLVRTASPYGYGRASYELNLGCNYDCEHCYLGLKKFEGLSWQERERLLRILRDAGVLWLQLTGGEPLIDKLFGDTYALACELGMMVSVSSNGSRLANPRILHLLVTRRPYRLTLSVYGATAESYDGLTRRPGSFAKFTTGLAAACEAGLPLRLNLIVARQNSHEVDAMVAMAERLAGHGFAVLHQQMHAGNVDGPVLVAVNNDCVVGAIGPMQTMPDPAGAARLLPQYFGVLPEARRLGRGRALWRAAMQWGAANDAAYQLLQTEIGGASERLCLAEGLETLGFVFARPA